MLEFKNLSLHDVPFRVLFIFRQMYKREINPSIQAQLLHGVYLAYLCFIYLSWFMVALLCFSGYLNVDYYGTICLYYMALSIVSHVLDKKLRMLLGMYNPLADHDIAFLSVEASLSEVLNKLADNTTAIKVFRPAVTSSSIELIDTFFQLSDLDKHKLYVMKYTGENDVMFHIVDSTMTRKLHIYFDEATSVLEVF